MHIPDGYLGPETIAAGWALTAPVWYRANRRTKTLLSQPRMIPVLAFGAAFSFLVMMLNVPVAGGTTAHAVGAVLVAVIAGPDVACLAVSAALVIQALFFGDGGILTLGINCLNMAVVMPYAGYAVYRLLAGGSALGSSRRLYAAGIGAWCGLVAAAALAGLELGIQPLLHSVDGVAQYSPYGLRTALIAMVGSHALIVGPIEAVFTVAVFAVLRRQSPELFAAGATVRPLRSRRLVALLAVFVAAVPLGPARRRRGVRGVEHRRARPSRRLRAKRTRSARGSLERPAAGLQPARRERRGGRRLVFVSALVGVALITAAVWLVVTLRRRTARAPVQSLPPLPPSRGAGASPSPGRLPARSPSPAGRVLPRGPHRLFSEHLVVTLSAWVRAPSPPTSSPADPDFCSASIPGSSLSACWLASRSRRCRRGCWCWPCCWRAFAVGLVAASRLGLARFAVRAWLFIPLFTAVVMLPVTLSVVSPGRAVLTLWSHGAPFWPLPATIAVTAPGLLAFLRLVARVTTVVSFSVLLTLTTPWAELLKALRAVGVPRGFVFVLAVAYRYVFTLVRIVQDMALARTSRLVGRAAPGEDRRFLGAAVATAFGKSQAASRSTWP